MTKRRKKTSNKSLPGRLRIVAGKWRSRLLEIADVPGLRPTSERIRETLFNWLAPSISGARCLDLFAGTGALGLEALSRGAASTVFVETSRKAAATLEANIETIKAGDTAVVVREDALDYLRKGEHGPFDIVFLDPPFAADLQGDLCRLLAAGEMLADGALVYLEEDRGKAPAEIPDEWEVLKSKAAGNVRYSLLGV
jgi:16S rRNA (guanine966-N2)-methyltransferase